MHKLLIILIFLTNQILFLMSEIYEKQIYGDLNYFWATWNLPMHGGGVGEAAHWEGDHTFLISSSVAFLDRPSVP